MAGYKGPVTTADYFKFDEEKALPVTEFFHTYKDRLPMIAIIVDGIYGLTKYDTFDCYQVVRLHCFTSQPRVVCMKEVEALNLGTSYITIPVHTNLRYQVVGNSNTVSKPMLLATLLKKCPLPFLARLDPSDDRKTFKVGTTMYAAKEFGNILIMEEYKEHYFKLNCLSYGADLKMNPVASMLSLNDEISLAPIMGFNHKSQQQFMAFVKQLDEQAAALSPQYDTTDGDPNFAEHLINPNAQLRDGRAIPVKLAPAEALRVIRSLQDTPLPVDLSLDGNQDRSPLRPPERSQSTRKPPRPPPLLAARSTSTELNTTKQQVDEDDGDYEELLDPPMKAVPPRLEGHRPFGAPNKDTVLGSAKTSNTKPGAVDDNLNDSEDTGDYEDPTDYEYPDIGYLHSPSLPPRRAPNNSTPKAKKSASYTMVELKSKHNKAKPDSKPTKETFQTNTSKAAILSQDTDNVSSKQEEHERESSKSPGYVNTNIGRATVKPQQQQKQQCPGQGGDGEPDGNDSMTYDDVMTVQCHVTEHIENQEDDYLVMEEIDLPPLSKNRPPKEQTIGPQLQRLNDPSGKTGDSTGTGQTDGAKFAGVKELSIAEVANVLHTLALDKYVKVFKNNKIDGEILSELTTEDLVTELNMKRLEAIRLHKYVNAGHIPK